LLLHWIVALAIVGMLVMGEILEDMPRGPAKSNLFWWHFSIGVTLFVFAVWRVIWRISQGFPDHVGSYATWELHLAKLVHWILLIGTLAMPLSGMLTVLSNGRGIDVWGLFQIPAMMAKNESLHELGEALHGAGAKIMIVALLLHVAGALKHHVIDRDGTLRRIVGMRVPPAGRNGGSHTA
jgi:cytochrome b561